MVMAVAGLYAVVLFFIEFDPIVCFVLRPDESHHDVEFGPLNSDLNSNPILPQHLQKKFSLNSDKIPDPVTSDPSARVFPDRPLPRKQFSPNGNVRKLLSPEIFSQPDPVIYLLEEIMKLSELRIAMVNYDLRNQLRPPSKLPQQYIPYAKALQQFAFWLPSLYMVKPIIDGIRRSSATTGVSLPPGLLSAEISELFSSDIFSDANAPFQLLIKLMNMQSDNIDRAENQLENLRRNDQLPKQYLSYVKNLHSFMLRKTSLTGLIQSVFELRQIHFQH